MHQKVKSSRTLQAEKTKNELVESGRRLLKENPDFSQISIQDITDACGVSTGTFYVYFPSKDVFFYYLCRQDYAPILDIKSRIPAPSYIDLLLEITKEWVLPEQRDISLYMSANWYSHLLDEPYHEAVGTNPLDPGFDYLTSIKTCLEKAKENDELEASTDIDELSELICSMWYGFAIRDTMRRMNTDYQRWSKILPDAIATLIAPHKAKIHSNREQSSVNKH